MEIQTAVHKIYQQLSVTLDRALQANKHHIGNINHWYICIFSKKHLDQRLVLLKFVCMQRDINDEKMFN